MRALRSKPKRYSNRYAVLAILFSFLTMISIEATTGLEDSTRVQIQREYRLYIQDFNQQTKLINEIEREISADILMSNDSYANAKMQIRDIQLLIQRFQGATLDSKDLLLVDIGFNLGQSRENLQKVLRNIR